MLLGEYTHIYFLCNIVLFTLLLGFGICRMVIPCCFPNICVVLLCCFGRAETQSMCLWTDQRLARERARSDSAAEGPAMHRAIFKLASIFYGKYIFKLFKVLGILSAGKNATAVTWQIFNGTFCYSHITWPVCSPEFSFRFLFYSLCKMRATLMVIWTLRISTFVIWIYQDCAF